MKLKSIAALLTAAGLAFSSAHAAPEAAESLVEVPVLILELQPGEGMSEQDQAMFAMLLMQLLGGMQAEGDNIEVQFIAPQSGQRI